MDADELRRAAAVLRSGGLVVFPTETVYGLGADALNEAAVERIFLVKGRPPSSPLIVHVDSLEMAAEVAAEWPSAAQELASKFWPGPLTLVLQKRESVPDRVTAGLPTVGVRMPAHPVAISLIREAGVPVAAPSANRYTELSPTSAEHVRHGLGSAVDMILDGGPCQVGIESTVISLVDARRPVLLRAGMIRAADVEKITGPLASGGVPGSESHPSPGMQERHYRPHTPLQFGTAPDSRCAYLWRTQDQPAGRSIAMPQSAEQYARQLYGVLHELDAEHWAAILVEPLPDEPEWAGIRDRLQRAASG